MENKIGPKDVFNSSGKLLKISLALSSVVVLVLLYLIIFVFNNNKDFNTKYSQDELNKIFEMDKKDPGTKLYYSEKLSVGFTYNPTVNYGDGTAPFNVTATERGNKIFLNDYQYFIEIFDKDPKISLEQAINKDFLSDVSNVKDCYVKSVDNNDVFSNKYLVSAYINDNSIIEDPSTLNTSCPQYIADQYGPSTGRAYFIAEKQESSKYAFLSLGNGDLGPSSGYPGDEVGTWINTIRFLK